MESWHASEPALDTASWDEEGSPTTQQGLKAQPEKEEAEDHHIIPEETSLWSHKRYALVTSRNNGVISQGAEASLK